MHWSTVRKSSLWGLLWYFDMATASVYVIIFLALHMYVLLKSCCFSLDRKPEKLQVWLFAHLKQKLETHLCGLFPPFSAKQYSIMEATDSGAASPTGNPPFSVFQVEVLKINLHSSVLSSAKWIIMMVAISMVLQRWHLWKRTGPARHGRYWPLLFFIDEKWFRQ